LKQVQLIQTGISNYEYIWKLQQHLFQQVSRGQTDNYLIMTEHHPVITIGQKSNPAHLLAGEAYLRQQGIELFHIDRGGDITFHGPGQLVGYPVLNLADFRPDVHWYLRKLEEVIIRTLTEFKIPAGRIENLTGVWSGDKKICAIGVKITRWVTMHGFALNVSTDLNFFKYIIPCGISGKGVTSIFEQSGNNTAINDVSSKVCANFAKIFNVSLLPMQSEKIKNLIEQANAGQEEKKSPA
jgi:lipoyl(octanoyl) transferase